MIRKVSDNIKYGNETLPATHQLGNLWVGHTTDGMKYHYQTALIYPVWPYNAD